MFSTELKAIESALTEVWEYQLPNDDIGYRLDPGRMKFFTQRAYQLVSQARHGIRLLGKGQPEIPQWGLDGRWVDVWHSGDFEILATALRVETDNFLVHLGDAFAELRNYGWKSGVLGTHQPLSASQVEKNPHNDDGFKGRRPSSRLPTKTRSQASPIGVERDLPPHLTKEQTRESQKNSKGNVTFTNPWKEHQAGENVSPRTTVVPEKRESEREEAIAKESARRASRNPFIASAHHPPPAYTSAIEPPGANLNMHIMGQAGGLVTSQKLQEIAGPTFGNYGDRGPSDEGSSSSSSDSEGNGDRSQSRYPGRGKTRKGKEEKGDGNGEVRFDYKLKVEYIPTWDGNVDTLGRWLAKINAIARQSITVF